MFTAVKIAELILEEAFSELQKSFGPKLNAETGRIFSMITFDKYNDIKVSEDYDIKISSLEKVQVADIDYFSNGTRDQVYFSLRMGIINLIFGNGQRIPLFLDDTFLQYDNYRIKPALEYLYEYSKKNQVIIFTCQKREIEIGSKWDIFVLDMEKN